MSAFPMSDQICPAPPPLQPSFVPAARWNREFHALVARDVSSRPLALVLLRPDGVAFRHDSRVLSAAHPYASCNFRYVERLLKFLLWQQGASRVLVAGADELGHHLADLYHSLGIRAFDHEFMGDKVYGQPFSVINAPLDNLPDAHDSTLPLAA